MRICGDPDRLKNYFHYVWNFRLLVALLYHMEDILLLHCILSFMIAFKILLFPGLLFESNLP